MEMLDAQELWSLGNEDEGARLVTGFVPQVDKVITTT